MTEDLTGIGQASKAAVELYKESGIKEFLKTLFGPATTELGLFLADIVKDWREKNLYKIAQKAQKQIQERQIPIIPISPKLSIQLIEGASQEEDENLQSKWAGLLASAASGKTIHPSFPGILERLSPNDAHILDIIFERNNEISLDEKKITAERLRQQLVNRQIDISEEETLDSLNILLNLNLCQKEPLFDGIGQEISSGEKVFLTRTGRKFMEAVKGV